MSIHRSVAAPNSAATQVFSALSMQMDEELKGWYSCRPGRGTGRGIGEGGQGCPTQNSHMPSKRDKFLLRSYSRSHSCASKASTHSRCSCPLV
eukprot:1160175-Pelagomonas_calceolata.AAC.2